MINRVSIDLGVSISEAEELLEQGLVEFDRRTGRYYIALVVRRSESIVWNNKLKLIYLAKEGKRLKKPTSNKLGTPRMASNHKQQAMIGYLGTNTTDGPVFIGRSFQL